jgi:hypothetical protein
MIVPVPPLMQTTFSVPIDDVPCELAAPGALVLRADAVAPVVARGEVASGPPHLRELQLARGLDDVLAEAVLVGERRGRVVDRTVERVEVEVGPVEADRLHEHAVDARIHLVDDVIDVDLDRRGAGERTEGREEEEREGTQREGLHLGLTTQDE